MGDLDGLPLQKLCADPPRDDRLEVGDALGLHALAFRFLPLSVEHEPHALGLLLGLQLFLDGGREQRRQRDRPEQDLLGLDSARCEGGAYVAASGWSRNSSETSRLTLMPGTRIRSETLPKK